MATVNGLTKEAMLEIADASVVSGTVSGDNLQLTTRGGQTIDAGNVRGPAGPTGPPGPKGDTGAPGPAADTKARAGDIGRSSTQSIVQNAWTRFLFNQVFVNSNSTVSISGNDMMLGRSGYYQIWAKIKSTATGPARIGGRIKVGGTMVGLEEFVPAAQTGATLTVGPILTAGYDGTIVSLEIHQNAAAALNFECRMFAVRIGDI